MGDAFLRNYYIYHDVGNARAGFFNKDLPINATGSTRRNLELEMQHALFDTTKSSASLIKVTFLVLVYISFILSTI